MGQAIPTAVVNSGGELVASIRIPQEVMDEVVA